MSKLVTFTASYYSAVLLMAWCLYYILPSCLGDTAVNLSCIFTILVLAYYSSTFFKKLFLTDRVSPHNRAVLITGCDSGFGHELAKRLDDGGYLVFACCLFPSGDGAKRLKESCSSRVHIVGLDVTKTDTVADSLTYVKEHLGNSELWAVVNNAGIYAGYGTSWTKVEDFEACMNVNALGPVRVTKTFLPLLRSSKGRVVNTTSLAGRIASPCTTAYTMSKFAAVAFSECLRTEIQPNWGIKVISIEPELFKTNIINFENLKNNIQKNMSDLDEDTAADYGEKYFDDFEKCIKRSTNLNSEKLSKVVDCLEDAVILEYPNNFYRPCRNIATSVFLRVLEASPRTIQEMWIKIYQYMMDFPEPKEAQRL